MNTNDRRRQLLAMRRRIHRQLTVLSEIRAELAEMNADSFSKPVAPDDHPWMLGIGRLGTELREMLSSVERSLE